LGSNSSAREFCVLGMAFTLDPRLEADTVFVKSLPLSDLLIMNDSRYPWGILVPRIDGARELHDLDSAQQVHVWAEIMSVSAALSTWDSVEKVNIGALGNVVSQLHIHIIGRHIGDPAWPGPVWGHSARVPYEVGEVDGLKGYLSRTNP
jgi:diadenosine tetraphosphate (Ap4A) HIT family hydrolase